MRSIFVLTLAIGLSKCLNEQIPLTVRQIEQPLIGFGTWNLKESPFNTSSSVSIAIQAGYRQIDCAAAYGNEPAVGKGIADGLKKAGLKRNEIWVTSKLWNDHHTPGRVEAGFNQTLSDLGLEYLDLYLMHWPVGKAPDQNKYHYDYVETWHAMERLLKTNRVRNIGVSNFSPKQLKELIEKSEAKPAVHQMELHPYLQQAKWVKAHQAHGISVTAYSPLGNMNPTYGDRAKADAEASVGHPPLLLENSVIADIGEKRGCTPAQVVLAWGMSRGTSVIPKSKHEKYIEENIGAIKCVLEEDDFARIEKVGEEYLTRFNNPGKGWGVHLFEGLDNA
ncbi:Aldo/keto reductase [Zopfia rhizophila CBS 207.26]|uniref:Aldo/keto reductase n=1 Tax=Zopfia rhizophila CBS 207.26 TaxID=1314779 RepID=A0A6A6DYS6_9PEZI|nr:Aldo/keto reductase [Zopfia rhizophila CBS 207.26]